MLDRQYLSVYEASKVLDYTVQHTRLLIRNEKLRGEKIGRDWIVLRESVTEYAIKRENNKTGTELIK